MAEVWRRAPLRFRRVGSTRPRAVLVNVKKAPEPSVGSDRVSQAQPFVPDGFIFPRPEDDFFDVVVRVPQLAVSTTVTQEAFRVPTNVKGAWIRRLGYGYNSPHGLFMVRTTVLINGAPPSRYLYQTVDTGIAGSPYQGSLPTVNIGRPEAPTETFIFLPSNSLIEVRFVNNSTRETFSCAIRLWGWFFSS